METSSICWQVFLECANSEMTDTSQHARANERVSSGSILKIENLDRDANSVGIL
jgi:hypothetical protein